MREGINHHLLYITVITIFFYYVCMNKMNEIKELINSQQEKKIVLCPQTVQASDGSIQWRPLTKLLARNLWAVS